MGMRLKTPRRIQMIFEKKDLAQRAREVDQKLYQNPLATVEVDMELAQFMGIFEEDAVDLEDIPFCEPGALDWFFNPESEDSGGYNGSGGGHGLV
jgi:hypothetical protein